MTCALAPIPPVFRVATDIDAIEEDARRRRCLSLFDSLNLCLSAAGRAPVGTEVSRNRRFHLSVNLTRAACQTFAQFLTFIILYKKVLMF